MNSALLLVLTSTKMTLIKITLPNGITKTTEVKAESTLKELLIAVECPLEGITVYNSGDTPMQDLERTMVDYNNWYIEKGYIPELYVKYS